MDSIPAPSGFSLLKTLSEDLPNVDLTKIKQKTESMNLGEIAELCAYKSIEHPDWAMLSGRLKTREMKMHTGKTFSETCEKGKVLLHASYYKFVMEHADRLNAIIVDARDDKFDWFGICTAMKSYLMKLQGKCIETPQHLFLRVAVWLYAPLDCFPKPFGEKSLEQSFSKIAEVYDDLSLHNYIHATPTLFNSGLRRPQLSSCFLMTVGDEMKHIAKSWHDSCMISKNSGGIGIDVSDLRHSEIGNSNDGSGIIKPLKTLNSIMDYVDQGGKRKGSAAIYLTEHHVDIFEFLEMKKPVGSEKVRAKELFYAVWMSDLFMKRVKNNETWSLFCPNIAKGLNDTWGEKFERLYEKYEREKKYIRQVPARKLWEAIYISQVETGSPYILFKDAANRKSNQQNLGTIRCSNLCAEILEYTSKDEIASCTLGNIVLNKCVKFIKMNSRPNRSETVHRTSSYGGEKAIFDFSKLERLARALVRNLNEVIDRNYYIDEVPQIKYSNFKNRPLGIGVQGFADVFAMMDYSWGSEESKKLNSEIFETIYYGAVSESIRISQEIKNEKDKKIAELKAKWRSLIEGGITEDTSEKSTAVLKEIREIEKIHHTYESYEGSPASKGLLQFDLWDQADKSAGHPKTPFRYNWSFVKKALEKYGMRNSLLIALMPTATTAHLIGNNECFEPFGNLISARTVLSGQFMVVNKHMVKDFQNFEGKTLLTDPESIWSKKLAYDIIRDEGSLQKLKIENYIKDPSENQRVRFSHLKMKYRTVYEIPQKIPVDLALDRGRYICQTQSFNVFYEKPSYSDMTSLLFYQWEGGAKTGIYYLRSKPASQPIQFALDAEDDVIPQGVGEVKQEPTAEEKEEKQKKLVKQYACTEDVCIMCQ